MNYASTIRRVLPSRVEPSVAQCTALLDIAGWLSNDPQSTVCAVESSYSWTCECSDRWLIAEGRIKQCPVAGGDQIGLIHALASHA